MSSKAQRRKNKQRQQLAKVAQPPPIAIPPGAAITVTQQSSMAYSGPIPPPAMLREFDEVLPGAADRILTMAEKQTDHRIAIEKSAISHDQKRSWGGLLAGWSVVIFIAGVSGWCILNGHDIAGTCLGVADLGLLAGTFVYGSESRRRERETRKK